MNELVAYVLAEIRKALRFRWYGLAAAWVIALGGWVYVAAMPDVYEASARVYVDTSSVLEPVLRDQIISPNVQAALAFVRESLLSADRLASVAREVGLDMDVRTEEDLDKLLRSLRSEIQIRTESGRSRRAGNDIYAITYRSTARERAVDVVRTLLDAFVEDTLGAHLMGNDMAERFLAERIDEYERRLQQAERALADFKRQNADRLPGSRGDYFTRLQSEREALAAANQQLGLLEAKRQRLTEQVRGEMPAVDNERDGREPPPNTLGARIRDYERRLETLLLEYTERHPDVIALRETLDRLKEQQEEQLAALGSDGVVDLMALSTNPVYQALQISLNEVEVDIATLKTDIAAKELKVQELQSLIDEVPEVEAELARLNRDYSVVYDQYVQLVRSRETQELTRQAVATDRIEFRVIEPPSAPLSPVAPPRMVLLLGVFVAAVGGGAGLCYLLGQLFPVFGSVRELQEYLELPVLGTVAHAWRDRHLKARRRAVIIALLPILGLVSLLVAALAAESMGVSLHELYERAFR